MFKTKNEAISAMNQIADLAMKLNVKFHCSPYGISIVGNNETQLFKLNKKELKKAHKFVMEQADPSLQTVLKPFYG